MKKDCINVLLRLLFDLTAQKQIQLLCYDYIRKILLYRTAALFLLLKDIIENVQNIQININADLIALNNTTFQKTAVSKDLHGVKMFSICMASTLELEVLSLCA